MSDPAREFYDSVFARTHAETGFAYSEDPDRHYVVPILRGFLDEHELADARCLEVGTGYGQCQSLVDDYTGIDIAYTSGRRIDHGFVNASATGLPFKDATFDCVWTNHVMEHVDRPDLMLEEIWRVLKPGGLVFLTATWQCGPWLAEGYPVRPYSDFGLKGKFTKLTWAIRDSVAFRSTHVFPRRITTLIRRRLRDEPVALHYRSLKPSYERNWMPDATAESSVEPYSVYSWFVSRGAECLNYPTEWRAFFIRTGHVTFRRPAEARDRHVSTTSSASNSREVTHSALGAA